MGVAYATTIGKSFTTGNDSTTGSSARGGSPWLAAEGVDAILLCWLKGRELTETTITGEIN